MIEMLNINGFTKIPRFLDIETLKTIIPFIEEKKNEINWKKNEVKIKYAITKKSLLIKLLKLQFKQFFQSLFLLKLNKKIKCNQILEKEIPNSKFSLISMDLIYNPIVDVPLRDWHADEVYNLRGGEGGKFKFFIYLTPTKKKSGSLAFIKKSQELNFLLADLMKKKIIPEKKLYSLNDFYEYLNNDEIKNILIKETSNETFNEVFNIISNVYNNPSTDTYDVECDAGDCILFNEMGIHRGAVNKENERFVLRFLYQKN